MPANFPPEYLKAIGTAPTRDLGLRQVSFPLLKPSPREEDEAQSADPLRVKGWHDFCHEKFKPLCQGMRERGAGIRFNKGLKKANMTLADLPQLEVTDSADPPRKGPCWKFLLRNCGGGESCNFVHIHPSQLTDEVVEACLPALKRVAKGLAEARPSKSPRKKRKRAEGPNEVTFGS